MMLARQSSRARRETGGPFRLGVGPPEEDDIEAQLAALVALTTCHLQDEWRRLYRSTPPSRLSRDLLLRGIAHRIQEAAHGGLGRGVRRQLALLAADYDRPGGKRVSPAVGLKPGTMLVREWHGAAHHVRVLEDGFEYRGEHYPSLTRIARRITGAAWSGPRFFGIAGSSRRTEGA